MKLSTHYYLSKIRNKDVADYLKEQIFNRNLDEKHVSYLVKNIATNDYIAQNIYPVCKALARGMSIGEIEATARLLPDACTQSIFALKDGEGDLYNVVPSHFEYLLESEADMRGKKRIIDLQNRMQDSFCMSPDLFWKLIRNSDGKFIFENIDQLEAIARNLEAYREEVEKISIGDLMEYGLRIEDFKSFDMGKYLRFVDEINENDKALLENGQFAEIRYRFEDSTYELVLGTNKDMIHNYQEGEYKLTNEHILRCYLHNPYSAHSDIKHMKENPGFAAHLAVLSQSNATKECLTLDQLQEKQSIAGILIQDTFEENSNHAYDIKGTSELTLSNSEHEIRFFSSYFMNPQRIGCTKDILYFDKEPLYGHDWIEGKMKDIGRFKNIENAVRFINANFGEGDIDFDFHQPANLESHDLKEMEQSIEEETIEAVQTIRIKI